MGAVYDATDMVLNVRRALKEMVPYPGTPESAMPQLRKQFRQEARLLAELRHSNLPRVTDYFEEDGRTYLVMDFVSGQRMDDIIAQKGKLTEEDALKWTQQLMEALAYCHGKGVIHRDIKPQNVIITAQKEAILVDFGLAKMADPTKPYTSTAMRGIGTPEYAPPEQYYTKQGHSAPPTDIYSLGALLYHALTGVVPSTVAERAGNPRSLAPVHEHNENISKATAEAIMKALSLQSIKRFQNVSEMHEALFGTPLETPVAKSVAPTRADTSVQQPPPSRSTVLLSQIENAYAQIDRRLKVGLTAAALALLATGISLGASSINWSGASTTTSTPTTITPTDTPTAPPSVTHTPTASPTATPSSTASPTKDPTANPTVLYEINATPDWLDRLDLLRSPSPSPTQVYIPPTSTPTSTWTPSPQPTARPRPKPTDTPTNTPTNTPPPTPTDTSTPTSTPTVRPTPTQPGSSPTEEGSNVTQTPSEGSQETPTRVEQTSTATGGN